MFSALPFAPLDLLIAGIFIGASFALIILDRLYPHRPSAPTNPNLDVIEMRLLETDHNLDAAMVVLNQPRQPRPVALLEDKAVQGE